MKVKRPTPVDRYVTGEGTEAAAKKFLLKLSLLVGLMSGAAVFVASMYALYSADPAITEELDFLNRLVVAVSIAYVPFIAAILYNALTAKLEQSKARYGKAQSDRSKENAQNNGGSSGTR